MIVATEFPLNRHETFRAELSDRTGLLVVSIARWKVRADGTSRRAGPALEFAAHRLAGVAELIDNVRRILEAYQNVPDPQVASSCGAA